MPGNGKQSVSLSRSDNKMMKHHSVFWNAAMHTNNASSCLSSRSSVILNIDHFFSLLIWKSSRGKRNNWKKKKPTHLLQTFALMFSTTLHTSPLSDCLRRVANLCKLSKLVQTPANPQTCATAKGSWSVFTCTALVNNQTKKEQQSLPPHKPILPKYIQTSKLAQTPEVLPQDFKTQPSTFKGVKLQQSFYK